ncbi:helix-turn-helix domain-containing protein [Belnapia sp. F-4-1]|uniref:helix-turn-helix domain-containing protein n=1 Tax=Belnapia sp. F-4-1 TaxID=1545443 RepID=UPI00118570F8|nr:helix-turn-helix transcriptional regulator [Belnapia sp. F-4-1]
MAKRDARQKGTNEAVSGDRRHPLEAESGKNSPSEESGLETERQIKLQLFINEHLHSDATPEQAEKVWRHAYEVVYGIISPERQQEARKASDAFQNFMDARRSQTAATTTTSSFAQLLEHHRKAAGLTREQLAFRSGVTLSQVHKLCRGEFEPRLSTLLALARGLGISASMLLPDQS